MAMLSVYKKIFKHMLSRNLTEVFNFRLFASFNLPELLYISVYSPGSYFKHSWFFGGEVLAELPNNNKCKNYLSSFHEINIVVS